MTSLLKKAVLFTSLYICMLSTNQMNAQIKLLEIWKALNMDGYPFKPRPISRDINRQSAVKHQP